MKTSAKLIALFLSASVATAFLSGCAGTSTRESTGEYIDNTAITARVKTAFAKDEIVRGRDVQVESFRGVVQLSGFVDSEVQKNRAGEIAKSIEGVQSVKNDLVVKPTSQ